MTIWFYLLRHYHRFGCDFIFGMWIAGILEAVGEYVLIASLLDKL